MSRRRAKILGYPGDPHTIDIQKGIEETLVEYPDIEIITHAAMQWEATRHVWNNRPAIDADGRAVGAEKSRLPVPRSRRITWTIPNSVSISSRRPNRSRRSNERGRIGALTDGTVHVPPTRVAGRGRGRTAIAFVLDNLVSIILIAASAAFSAIIPKFFQISILEQSSRSACRSR